MRLANEEQTAISDAIHHANTAQLGKLAQSLAKNGYGQYLLGILKEKVYP